MPGSAPWDLVGAARDGTAGGVHQVEDPAAVAAQLADAPGVVVVDAADLPAALAAVRVGLAGVLVERARHAESIAPVGPPPASDAAGADHDADRQAVRFALLILLFALAAGLAVHAVDGMLLAPALPAAALVGLGVVVLAHRRPRTAATLAAPAVGSGLPPGVDDAPSVRAAEAHLRRQRAAWKRTWWERGVTVPELGRWSPAIADGGAVTVVVVDPSGTVDEADHAAIATTLPDAVSVAVLRARAPGPETSDG